MLCVSVVRLYLNPISNNITPKRKSAKKNMAPLRLCVSYIQLSEGYYKGMRGNKWDWIR